MASIGSELPRARRLSLPGLIARVRNKLADGGERSLAQRLAGAAFLIRVASAGIAFGSQVVLARWMGTFEFGIYVYVWTWVLLIGGLVDLGLASSAQRFIPQYNEHGAFAKLRGFLSGSRWLAFGIAIILSCASAFIVYLLRHWLDDYTIVPLYIACASLPVFGVMHVQDGIARSYNWVNLALLPPYIIRQTLLIALMGLAYLAKLPTDAVTAVAAGTVALWLTAFGQTFVLNRKLAAAVPTGPKQHEIKPWLTMSVPMFLVEGLYLGLTYIDVIVLQQFSTPEEIAIYYAAAKTLAFVAFVYFAVSTAVSHKIAAHHVAGDRERLAGVVADAVRWTFWPSLVTSMLVLACGLPLLSLFGSKFVGGYSLMFIMTTGFLARAIVGPGERILSMMGQQRACAMIAAAVFAVNLTLCLLLIPHYGPQGAAIAMAAAFITESILVFTVAKRRLGLHLFVWRPGTPL